VHKAGNDEVRIITGKCGNEKGASLHDAVDLIFGPPSRASFVAGPAGRLLHAAMTSVDHLVCWREDDVDSAIPIGYSTRRWRRPMAQELLFSELNDVRITPHIASIRGHLLSNFEYRKRSRRAAEKT
jgi:hypothetical protein